MTWKATCPMEERFKFIEECRSGQESMSELCRHYGVSRKTAYKWLRRHQEEGFAGLIDRSRARLCQERQVMPQMEELILECRQAHPSWGPRKLKVFLEREHPGQVIPASSTIGTLLSRYHLTRPRKRRRRVAPYTKPFIGCDGPNKVWCVDYKGWFRTGDGSRCEPLTITDAFSRYLLRLTALDGTGYDMTRRLMEATFREYGLPEAIRSDNGTPFASRGPAGLSRLSAWWVRLGITPERIEPGKPQQNGRHERMHLTLKKETASPAAWTMRKQQTIFDQFREEFNRQRPHEALDQETPVKFYAPSLRQYPQRMEEYEYPSGMVVRKVQQHGEIYWGHESVFLSEVLYGEHVGLSEREDGQWEVFFCHMPVGWFDERRLKITRLSAARVKKQG